jgi:hypothetical protein
VASVTTRNTTGRYRWVYLSVAPSVDSMTQYEELGTPAQMRADCEAVNSRLARAAEKVAEHAPSIHYDDFPREVPKKDIRISEAAQRLANALHLHLD